MKFIYKNIGYLIGVGYILFCSICILIDIVNVNIFGGYMPLGYEGCGWSSKNLTNYTISGIVYSVAMLIPSIWSLLYIKNPPQKAKIILLFSWMILIIIVLIESDISIYDLFLILLI